MVDLDRQLPRYDDIIAAARVHAAASAMQAAQGNITHAAEWSKTTRRTIRNGLKEGGLYPWIGNIYLPMGVRDILTPPFFEDAGLVEDGRKGLVTVKFEQMHPVTGMYAGPACLIRDEETARLWPGEWVTWHRARTYALRHGHEF